MEKEKEKLRFDDLFSNVNKKPNKITWKSCGYYNFNYNVSIIVNVESGITLDKNQSDFLKTTVKEKDRINDLGHKFRLLSIFEAAMILAPFLLVIIKPNYSILDFGLVVLTLFPFLCIVNKIKLNMKESFKTKAGKLKDSIDSFFKKNGSISKNDIECYDYGTKVKTNNNNVKNFDDWLKINNVLCSID